MFFKLLIQYFIFAFYTTGIITEGANYLVFGGNKAERGQFPYMVSVQNVTYNHQCGGVILSSWWILTADHCIKKKTENDVKIALGSIYLKPPGMTHDVQQLVFHEQNETYCNDVGLIKVTKEIVFNNDTQPIAITDDLQFESADATVIGW